MSGFWPEEAELAAIPAAEPTREAEYMVQLRRILASVDRAMDAEGIASTTRARVVSRVLHGVPTVDATRDDDEPGPGDLAVVEALAAGLMREPACVPSVNLGQPLH